MVNCGARQTKALGARQETDTVRAKKMTGEKMRAKNKSEGYNVVPKLSHLKSMKINVLYNQGVQISFTNENYIWRVALTSWRLYSRTRDI